MYKVLIVDDEQLIRSGMIARFQYLNFKFERIREAASGVEALALLEKEPADIVITDIKMPDMDGMTLIREAKEKYPGTQFVILSGYAEFEYAETAIELGVKSYLLKPISNDELKRVMRKLFETLEKERQMEVEIFRKHQLETEQKGWLQEKAVNHLWQDNAAFLTEEEAAQLKSTCPELWKKEKGSLYLVVINIDAKSYEGKKFRHEDIELIRFSVQNVFEEMRSGCWKLIVSNLANPNQLYAMFGRGKVSELRREIERMFLRIQVLFEEKMEIYLTFGVSRPTDFPDKTCVKEAGEALRQRMISGSSNLYFYEDLQVLQSVVFPSVELKMPESVPRTQGYGKRLCASRRNSGGGPGAEIWNPLCADDLDSDSEFASAQLQQSPGKEGDADGGAKKLFSGGRGGRYRIPQKALSCACRGLHEKRRDGAGKREKQDSARNRISGSTL
ncbi:MAG: response regulator [Gallintestinimicrobium sp.]